MSPRLFTLGAAIMGLATAAVIGTREALRGDETPPAAGDVAVEPSKAVPLRDGGTGYAAEYRTSDGGLVTRLVQADCVRRLADAGVTRCRRVLPDGGIVDQGALNRFPADASVGVGCQKCACSVYLGDDANSEETVLIERTREPREGER